MIINQLLSISLLILSVVLTADLFIHQDKILAQAIKNFEKSTQKLHEKKQSKR